MCMWLAVQLQFCLSLRFGPDLAADQAIPSRFSVSTTAMSQTGYYSLVPSGNGLSTRARIPGCNKSRLSQGASVCEYVSTGALRAVIFDYILSPRSRLQSIYKIYVGTSGNSSARRALGSLDETGTKSGRGV